MPKFLITAALLSAASLHALVEKEINEKIPIEICLSKTSHNRICVEGGIVAKVIGSGSFFAITLDPTTGNAFINVLQEILKEPCTLTVVTSSGLIQDLSVNSKDGPGEQIILKEGFDTQEELVCLNRPHASTVELLNQILEDKVPYGYGQRPIITEDFILPPNGLKIHPLKAFEGPFDSILAYSIENNGKHLVKITAESFKNEGNTWIFLNAHELQPKQRAVCLVSKAKDGN